MCAALLGWPQATFASSIKVADGQLEVTREIDEGQQQVAVRLPAVVTTDLRLNTPRYARLCTSCVVLCAVLWSLHVQAQRCATCRYASFKAVIAAKKKSIQTIALGDLGLQHVPQLKVVLVQEPPKREVGRMVQNVAELVDELTKIKVI
jgi:electron transfer flavoprotein beta subunit